MEFAILASNEKAAYQKSRDGEFIVPMELTNGTFVLPTTVLQSERLSTAEKSALDSKSKTSTLKVTDFKWKADFDAKPKPNWWPFKQDG